MTNMDIKRIQDEGCDYQSKRYFKCITVLNLLFFLIEMASVTICSMPKIGGETKLISFSSNTA